MNKALLIAALIPACATEPTTTTAQPIAEVELASGAIVSFYETSPGAIAISEQYAIGEAPVPTIGRSASEVYRSIAPGQPVPDLLLAAEKRAVEARASRPHAPLPPPRASFIDNKTVDDKWFADTYCGGSWDNIWCRLNMTTGAWKQHADDRRRHRRVLRGWLFRSRTRGDVGERR